MLDVKAKKYDVAIVIARFQVPELHKGHIEIMNTVLAKHNRVIVALGVPAFAGSQRNPLDFKAREAMVKERYPNVTVIPIKDQRENTYWTAELDKTISSMLSHCETACIYGSRDSFIKCYSGKFDVIELVPNTVISGATVREKVAKHYEQTAAFRAGYIAACYNRFPIVKPTVDVAIIRGDSVYLGFKPGVALAQFPGGFVEKCNIESHDQMMYNARKEVNEETGLECTGYELIGHYHVADWRHIGVPDWVVTTFYLAQYQSGCPKAADDIVGLELVPFKSLFGGGVKVIPEHEVLVKALHKHLVFHRKTPDIPLCLQ